jgi:hypothetical protein
VPTAKRMKKDRSSSLPAMLSTCSSRVNAGDEGQAMASMRTIQPCPEPIVPRLQDGPRSPDTLEILIGLRPSQRSQE